MGMLDKAFEVAVVFSAVDHLTRPMNQMAGQMGILDEKTKQMQQRLNEFKNMTFIGGAITAAGGALVGKIEEGLDAAGDFLTKMTIIKDTVGATADQMDRIQKTVRAASGPTIFGISDTAAFAQKLATSGMSDQQINQTLPIFTQFAEVQKLGKGTAPEESLTQAIGAAHMVGAYDPKDLLAFLDKYNKATFMQPGASSEFADTFKYLAPSGAALGMKTDDMLTLSALANRVGLAGSMGGTNAADMILRSIPGLMGGKADSKKDSRQVAALKELGLDNSIYDKSGQFLGVENFVAQLQKASTGQNPEKLARLYHDIFGMQGMRLAQILSSERGQEQLKAITENMNQMKSISEMQEDINQTPEGQALQLKSNIENIKLDVWLQLAQILLPIVKDVNKLVSSILAFSQAHPQIARMAAEFMIFATAAALIIGPILLLVGAIGYLSTAKSISTGFKLFGTAIKSAVGPIGLLIAAGYLLYQAWQTDFGGIREKTAVALDWIKKEAPIAIQWLKQMAKALGFQNANGGLQMPGWLKIVTGLMVGGKTFSFLGGGALKGIGAIAGLFKAGGIGRILGGDLVEGILRVILGGEKFGPMSGVLRGAIKKALSGGLKGLEGIGKAIFGKQTIDLAKWLGLKGFSLAKLLGKGGFNLAKLLGKGTLTTLRVFGSLVGTGAKIAGNFGLTLLKLGGQALIAGARMAAAWVIGLGPIGWIIMGVIALVALLVAAWKNDWGHIREHTAEVVKWIKDHFTAMIEWFKELPGKMAQFGKDIVTGLWNGIVGLGTWLKDKVTSWIKSVLPDVIRDKLGISSPSKLMRDYGMYTAQGLALGITDNAHLVKNAAQNLSLAAEPEDPYRHVPALARSGGSTIDQSTHIEEGAIVVHAAPNHSEEDIANRVMIKLARRNRNQTWSRPTPVIPGVR